jgi:hypothetical protein
MTADPIPVLTQSARDRGEAPREGGAKDALARRQGRFGIRIKLLAAFAVVAAMTVVAAEVAIVSFSATERGVERVATQEVPVMTDALRLSATSGEISAARRPPSSGQHPKCIGQWIETAKRIGRPVASSSMHPAPTE